MVLETAVDLIEVYLFPLKEEKVSNNQPPSALQKASRNMLISHVGEKRKKYWKRNLINCFQRLLDCG